MEIFDNNFETVLFRVFGEKKLDKISDSQLKIINYDVKYETNKDGNLYREIHKNGKTFARHLYR